MAAAVKGDARASKITASPFFQADQKVRSASGVGKAAFIPAPAPTLSSASSSSAQSQSKPLPRSASASGKSAFVPAPGPTLGKSMHNNNTANTPNNNTSSTPKAVPGIDRAATVDVAVANKKPERAARPDTTTTTTTTTITKTTTTTEPTTTETTTTTATEVASQKEEPAKKPERLRKTPSVIDPMKDAISASPAPTPTTPTADDTQTPSPSSPSSSPAATPSVQSEAAPQSPKKPDKPASRSQKMPIPSKSPAAAPISASAAPSPIIGASAAPSASASPSPISGPTAAPELAKLPSETPSSPKPTPPARKSTKVALPIKASTEAPVEASGNDDAPSDAQVEAEPEEQPSDDDIDLETMELPLPPPPVPGGLSGASTGRSTGERTVVNKGWLQQSATDSKFMGRHLDMWKKRWVVVFSDAIVWYNLEEDHSSGKPALGEEKLDHTLIECVAESDLVLSVSLGAPSHVTLRFKCASAENKNEWESAFEEVREAHLQREGLQDLQEQREAQLAKMLQPAETKAVVQSFKEGWLLKQGSSIAPSLMNLTRIQWKKRWVTLTSAGLTYAESEKGDKRELAFIPFDHNFAFVEGKENTFTFQCNSRSIPFKADSPAIRGEWIAAMATGKNAFANARPEEQDKDFGVADLKAVPQPREEKLVDKNCIREGYLTKQGETRKSLKSRYFVLSQGELRYYKHPKDLKPIGSIALQAKSVAQASKQEAFTFFLVPVPNGRRFVLSAKDAQDQVNWLEALKTSMPEMTVVKGIASGLLAQSAGRDLLQVTRRSTRSIREGFILKQGHLNKNWKRRYFVLEPTMLEYFKNPLDRHSKGSVPLGNTGDSATADTDVRFTIVAGSPKKVSFILCCENPVDLLAWMAALQQVNNMTVIGKRQRVGKSQSAFSIDSAVSASVRFGLGRRAKDI